MRKSTHTGTCQVCGREQALPSGVLSKHGYVVPHGFFQGVCPGADNLPLETSRKLADEVAASLLRQRDAERARAERLTAGTETPARGATGRDVKNEKGRWITEYAPFAELDAYHQGRAVDKAIYDAQQLATEADRISGQITHRANLITGKRALKPVAAKPERKVIAAGSKVKLHGYVHHVLYVEDRVARGAGPYLNGHVMPHAVMQRDGTGQPWAYPTRLIRQASIL